MALPSAMPYLFFFNDTATTEIYTLSLHDALPISTVVEQPFDDQSHHSAKPALPEQQWPAGLLRSEEHTSELQSHSDLVCRLLLEKNTRPALGPDRLPPQAVPGRLLPIRDHGHSPV